MDSRKTVTVNADTDFSSQFERVARVFTGNPHIFEQTRAALERMIIVHDGKASFDTNYDNAVTLISSNLDENIHAILIAIHTMSEQGQPPALKDLTDDLRSEVRGFAAFVAPLLKASVETQKAKERQTAISLQALKESIIRKPIKKALILADWLTKWAVYLQREETFSPQSLKAYKQREIILVDFGFNVGGEFGGRHYAVVLEKDNNPKASVILVAPISSYDPARGQRPHASNVDLGIGAIHSYAKGAQVVMNQIRYISKLRIEKPKTSQEPRIFMDAVLFQQVTYKLHKRFMP